MGFYSKFRFIWRMVSLTFLTAIVSCAIWFTDLHTLFHGEFRFVRHNLLPLLFPAVTGFVVGSFGRGLHVVSIFRTLPNFRRHIIYTILCLGIATALLISWVYTNLGGSAPWLPIFTSGFLWFKLGIVSGWNLMYITKNDTDLSEHRTHSVVFAFSAMLMLFLAGFWSDKLAVIYQAHAFLSVLLTTLGATLCFCNVFGVAGPGKRTLFLRPSAGRTRVRIQGKNGQASKRGCIRKWRHTGPITRLLDWIRAGEFENFSIIPGRWLSICIGISAVTVLITAAGGYIGGHKRGSHEMGIQFVYHTLVDPATFKNNTHVIVSMIPALVVSFFAVFGSLFLKRGWLYPLSRSQLARYAYIGSLICNTVFCGILLLSFYFSGILVGLLEGYGVHFGTIPDLIRPLILIFAVTPLIHWLRLRDKPAAPFVALFLIFPVVGVLGSVWLEKGSGVSSIYEILGCSALILVSQGLFRYKVETYFRRADLV